MLLWIYLQLFTFENNKEILETLKFMQLCLFSSLPVLLSNLTNDKVFTFEVLRTSG